MDWKSRRWLRPLVLVLPLVLVVAACSGDDGEASETTVTTDAADVDSGRPTRTTIPVEELGDFELGELETIGIVTKRIREWVVIGDGRYVAFTQPPGEERGARVRVLDRSRAKVRTVDADLSSVSALHPAGDDGGVAYLSSTGPARSISFVAVDGEPVDLVSVRAGTTSIDSVAVDPTQNHVVWRELRQGRVQVLLSSDLDGGSIVLDESVSDGMIGEGAEDPIVLTEEGTVRYYADPDADGEATWYEVPIDGGAPAEVAAP